jgi:2'-5' RNA ligase
MRGRIELAAAALRVSPQARRVPHENFHTTLAFVGEVAASRLALLQKIGRGLRATGFTLEFDAYEYWREARVVVAAARDSPRPLVELCARLHRDLGLELPGALRPHVTLARKVAQAPVPQAMSPFPWRAASFSLIHSDTRGTRPVYTVVDTWPLLDEPPKP